MLLPIVFSSFLTAAKASRLRLTGVQRRPASTNMPLTGQNRRYLSAAFWSLPREFANIALGALITVGAYGTLYIMLALALPVRWVRMINPKRPQSSRRDPVVGTTLSIKEDEEWYGAANFMTSETTDTNLYVDPAKELSELIELVLKATFDDAASTWVSVSAISDVLFFRVDYSSEDYEVAGALRGGLGSALQEILEAVAGKHGMKCVLEIHSLPKRRKANDLCRRSS